MIAHRKKINSSVNNKDSSIKYKFRINMTVVMHREVLTTISEIYTANASYEYDVRVICASI